MSVLKLMIPKGVTSLHLTFEGITPQLISRQSSLSHYPDLIYERNKKWWQINVNASLKALKISREEVVHMKTCQGTSLNALKCAIYFQSRVCKK